MQEYELVERPHPRYDVSQGEEPDCSQAARLLGCGRVRGNVGAEVGVHAREELGAQPEGTRSQRQELAMWQMRPASSAAYASSRNVTVSALRLVLSERAEKGIECSVR